MRTTQALIALVNEALPEDLSDPDIAELRAQLPHNRELQAALAERLKLDAALVTLLGPAPVLAQAILERARLKPVAVPVWKYLGLAVIVLAAGSTLGWMVLARGTRSVPAITIENDASAGNAANSELAETGMATSALASGSNQSGESGASPGQLATPSLPADSSEPAVSGSGENVAAAAEMETNPGDGTGVTPATAGSAGLAVILPVDRWTVLKDLVGLKNLPERINATDQRFAAEFAYAGQDELSERTFRRWFAPVEGQSLDLGQDQIGSKRTIRMNGLVKLKTPWPTGARWRFTPFDIQELTIRAFSGDEGVVLQFHPHRAPRMWSAFVARRKSGEARANHLELVSSDGGAFSRSNEGTLDLFWQDGILLLIKGGVVLLRAPLPSAPEELVFEGNCRLRGWGVENSEPVDLSNEPLAAVVAPTGTIRPTGLEWTVPQTPGVGPGIELKMGEEGRVRLEGTPKGQPAFAFTLMPDQEQLDVVFRLSDLTEGAGCYFGDRLGNPVLSWMAVRDSRSGRLVLVPMQPWDQRDKGDFEPAHAAVVYYSPAAYVRFVRGPGIFSIFTSHDGQHWGPIAESPVRGISTEIACFGLQLFAGEQRRFAELETLQTQDSMLAKRFMLPHLQAWLPHLAGGEWNDFGMWEQRTAAAMERVPLGQQQPLRMASAVRALGHTVNNEMADKFIKMLGKEILVATAPINDEPPDPTLSFDQAITCLQELPLLIDSANEQIGKEILAMLSELGQRMAKRTHLFAGDEPQRGTTETVDPTDPRSHSEAIKFLADAAQQLRSVAFTLPLASHGQFTDVLHGLDRQILIDAAFSGERAVASRTAHQMLSSSFASHPDRRIEGTSPLLAEWVLETEKSSPQSGAASAGSIGFLKHPLVNSITKEGFNFRAEFLSAIDSLAFRDAARILEVVRPGEVDSLIPAQHDEALAQSLELFTQGIREQSAPFRKSIVEDAAPLAQVRLRQAMAAGDADRVQTLLLRFAETPVASEAATWMGDRALSTGESLDALCWYRQGFTGGTPEQVASLRERAELAAALCGDRRIGDSDSAHERGITPDVALPANDGRNVAPNPGALGIRALPAGWRELAAELAPLAGPVNQAPALGPEVLPQDNYRAEPICTFDGPNGNNAGKGEYRYSDAGSKQLSMTALGNRLCLGNRFQLTLVDRATGQTAWTRGVWSGPWGDSGEAYNLPFEPFVPVAQDDRIVTRRLLSTGADVGCYGAADGAERWKFNQWQALSDAWPVGRELHFVAAEPQTDDSVRVHFVRLDGANGKLLRSQAVLQLQGTDVTQLAAGIARHGTTTLVTLPGVSLACDLTGRVLWQRRHAYLSPARDDLRYLSRERKPLIVGETAYLASAGSRLVEAVSVQSGERLWQCCVPRLSGMISASIAGIVVVTPDEIVTLQPSDGRIVWRRTIADRLEAMACDHENVLYSRVVKGDDGRFQPELVWRKMVDGSLVGRKRVDLSGSHEITFGPFLSDGNDVLVAWGEGWQAARREVVRLRPKSVAEVQ